MSYALQASGNVFEDRARALKAQRLALILHGAGARTSGEVQAMGVEARSIALGVYEAGLGLERGSARASERTWRGVASLVGYLGGGSGGRRQCATVPSRIGVDR